MVDRGSHGCGGLVVAWHGMAWALRIVMGLSRGSAWCGGSSGYLFCLWVKIKWVCGGLVVEIMAHRWWVLVDRRGVVKFS